MQTEFQAYVNNPQYINDKMEEIKETYSDWCLYLDEAYARDKLIHEFVNNHSTFTFDIDDGIFNSFNDKTKLELLKKFEKPNGGFGYSDGYQTDYEVIKMVSKLWSKYMSGEYSWKNPPRNWPHNEYFQYFYTIQTCLREFYAVSESNFTEFRKKHYQRTGEGYPYKIYLGFLHLLPDAPDILERIYKLPYDDAQEHLFFALANFPMPKGLPILRRVFQYWDKNSNSGIHLAEGTGTGIMGDLRYMVITWLKRGFNNFLDPVIGPILMKYVSDLRPRPPIPQRVKQ